jgi:hypothetical protein
MGDSGRRKKRIKIPLIGWEGTACEKDARSRGSIAGEIPDVEQGQIIGCVFAWAGERSLEVCLSIEGNRRSLHCATPDFLLRLVALANFMRLSLLKAAHVAAGECRAAGNPGSLRSG